ncbi:RHS repeat-associated core domain-containing protein [Metapseudomonas resinovorans]|uniref:ParB-like N-terminal domain-containing protein n=1 Tax=Metapseudomonas resinovorans NBRC 106553 TaxID=1245471 RepID=S6AL82_METRE|nr:RHS repeat-associated core domain-containing protein [Pseudomonas resinovorans]BAN46028.1 hypothetical protein PCA10_02960 [Pseudomonas resinovorans NBRC 106553]
MGRVIAFLLGVLLLGPVHAATQVYTTYYHNDHLGSPAAATDERNELLWRAHYRPYGERQESPGDIPFGSPGYTGHVQDSSSGLVYMQARYYDPQLGRFLSMDPMGPQETVPGSFNRYAYGLNNPYRYVDPDGRNPLLVLFGGVTVGAGMMTHADFANAPAEGEATQNLGTLDHLGALPGLQGSKGRSFLRISKDSPTVGKASSKAVNEPSVTQVDPRNLIPTQTKNEMSGSQIKRLEKSMKKDGFDQSKPVDVWKRPDGRLEIQDGHHRTEAAKKAELKSIPVRVWE